MINKIPSTLQSLLTLGDIAYASKEVSQEDYFQLKRDHQNLVSAVTTIIEIINGGEFSTMQGSGSPEGVTTANYSLLYIDTDVSQLYYNPEYGAITGWIAL